jgi:hypothetical protein
MRTLTAIAILAMALAIDARAPVRAAAPWCAWFTGYSYSSDCGYYTLEQCVATVRGVGGYCAPNAYAQPLPYPPGPYRKRHPRRYD